jgi:hypothetical protein
MEFNGSHQSILILIGLGVLLATLAIILVFRMMRAAWPLVSDDVARSRLRRINVCFALFGCLILAVLWAQAQPWERQQGAAALVGIFFAAPLVCIAGPIALYNSVLLWRVTSVRALWIISLLFALMTLAEEMIGPSLSTVLALAYALLVIALAIRGLTKGRWSQS